MTNSTHTSTHARKPIGLALQGGGSWGAYTWGVLDGLLASRTLGITALSGTSAGALNAAIVASELAKGSPAKARERLRAFWLAVASPAVADIGRDFWGPAERRWRETVLGWLVSGNGVSPYQLNPLGINPLRDIIAAHVDIDAIRSSAAPALHVTVTHVRTGLPRVISNAQMSIDALLASACLPQLFQAVEIDGEPYWDGGYSGNPTLWPLVDDGASRDLVVVQLTPDESHALPTDAGAIHRRIDQIVFASSLVAEMQSIAAMRAVASGGGDRRAAVLDVRLHRIGPPSVQLSAQGSPLERSRAWLHKLRDEGCKAARRFIARDGAAIGVRETLDIARVYADPRTARHGTPANEHDYRLRANSP
ncbi:MAG TPA: patatin-like phospholipase family protein [Casimicrobiaceae bacterium]|nr:patatin-like phospholipase family protein [Casimicrobiaceae bacterium]